MNTLKVTLVLWVIAVATVALLWAVGFIDAGFFTELGGRVTLVMLVLLGAVALIGGIIGRGRGAAGSSGGASSSETSKPGPKF